MPDKSLKRRVTALEAVKILKNNGIDITEKEAEKILDFLYFLGKLTVNQYFNKDKNSDLKPPLL